MSKKPCTLPDVQQATRQAIDECYSELIANDLRWIAYLPQFDQKPRKKGKRQPIELISTYSDVPPKRGENGAV